MKNLIKRVQSRACSSFAERKNFGPLAKQKVFFILALLLLAVTAHAEEVTGVTYLYYANQAAAIAQTPSTGTANCTKVEASSTEVTWNSGWYVVNEDVTISARVDIVGVVNLILADGATLTSTACINTNGATLNIYGQTQGTGTLNASSTNGPAAIGGRGAKDGGTLTIHGGIINATGGNYKGAGAAGIGGGALGGNGGIITINGGTVTATGGEGGRSAAGIGGSEEAHCGVITINGGTVTATGPDYDGDGPGIGNGGYYQGTEGQVIINGGTVTATGGTRGAGIGGGGGAYGGTVTITGGDVTAIGIVGAGIGGGCNHGGNVTITGGTVRAYSQDFDNQNRIGAGLCDGYSNSSPGTLTLGDEILVKAAQADESTDWEALPVVARESFLTNHSMRRVYIEPLKKLAETDDNADWLAENNGLVYDITLSGRTLYKDGDWNTLCLPFDVDDFTGTIFADATVKTLVSSNFAGGTLTMNFSNVTSIEAGKPYIVKWENSDTDISNPVFSNVTISNTTDNASTTCVDFVGTYSPTVIYESGDKHNLYLGAANKLYYPSTEDFTVNACRGYFQLKNGLIAGEPKSVGAKGISQFVLDFGDENGEATGIRPTPNPSLNGGEWYDLSGRRLSGKPAQSGIYIHNGNKIVIK